VCAQGLLKKGVKITSADDPLLLEAQKCLDEIRYWRDWVANDFVPNCTETLTKEDSRRLRLDPRTWGLTEMMVNGYRAYARDFFLRYPHNHYITTLRMTQSALEAIFSMVRRCGGDNRTPSLDLYGRHIGTIAFQRSGNLRKANVDQEDFELNLAATMQRDIKDALPYNTDKPRFGKFVMDELKISDGWTYRNKSGVAIGLLCSMDDLCEMRDVFATLDEKKKVAEDAQYVLQFLWRDELSGCDVIGPWFPWTKGMNSQQLDLMFWKVVEAYAVVNMHTHAVIFDGAPQNYGFARMNVLDNEGQWCYNHYNTTQEDAKIFFIVEPAHMIKNFRNQLHASLNG
jgi:hypothetical protein